EARDLDVARLRRDQLRQVFRLENDRTGAVEREGLAHVVLADVLPRVLANDVLLDRRAVLCMEQVEANSAVFDGRIQLDRELFLAELQPSFPDRSSRHRTSPRSLRDPR